MRLIENNRNSVSKQNGKYSNDNFIRKTNVIVNDNAKYNI